MATLNGGEGNDKITGTNNNDIINARSGDDTIYSKDGDDEVYSGSGNDFIDSGSGNDFVFLRELSGNSLSSGNFKIQLGSGDDRLYAVLGIGHSSDINGGLGFDTIAFGTMSGTAANGEYYRTEHDLSNVYGFERWIFNNNNNGLDGTEKFNALHYFGGEARKISMSDSNFFGVDNYIEVYFGNYNSLDLFDASSVTSGGIYFHVENGDGWTLTKGSTQGDKYFGQGSADKFQGNQGDDFFDGGDGIDTAVYSDNYSNYTISEITYNTFSVKDNVGTDGTDTIIDVNNLQFLDQTVDVEIKGMEIIGDDSAEEISGGDEADHLDGAGGNDILDGGLGNDLIDGGTGNDELLGGQGNDFLNGGDGVDQFAGDAGNDELNGGAGDDLVNYSGIASRLTINLTTGAATGEGTDTLISIEDVIGGSNNDTITGSDDSNEITAGSGDDVVTAGGGDDLIVGGDGAGNDTYNGGTGIDTIKYTSAKSGITVNLAAASNQAKSTLSGDKAGIGVDQLSGIENIIAGNYDDLLTGNAAANTITAGSGNDTIDGGSSADKLIGGTGNDTYIVDLYKSGTTLKLQDTVTEAASAGTDTLKLRLTTDQKLAAQTFILAANLENLDASNTSTNKINLTGNSAANTLTGNAAANTLKGEAGSDILYGGLGSDSLYGGADKVKDVFDFNSITESKVGTGRDKVYNYVKGIDDLDLKTIDANTKVSNDQAFKFAGTKAGANSLWYAAKDVDGSTSTKDIIVYGDVNGDAKADFEIGLVGVTSLTSADFVL